MTATNQPTVKVLIPVRLSAWLMGDLGQRVETHLRAATPW